MIIQSTDLIQPWANNWIFFAFNNYQLALVENACVFGASAECMYPTMLGTFMLEDSYRATFVGSSITLGVTLQTWCTDLKFHRGSIQRAPVDH